MRLPKPSKTSRRLIDSDFQQADVAPDGAERGSARTPKGCGIVTRNGAMCLNSIAVYCYGLNQYWCLHTDGFQFVGEGGDFFQNEGFTFF